MTPLTLSGATVPGPDGPERRDIGLRDGLIRGPGAGRVIDLSGLLLLPGIVDPHGDGFERHLAPRRGAAVDLALGLAAAEAEILANGITTACLAQSWSWEGGMRGPEFAARLAEALAVYRGVADLRMQLRIEIGPREEFDAAAALVERFAIPFAVFNDHLPHDAVAKGRKPPSLEGQALKAGRSPEAHRAFIERMCREIGAARAELPALAARLRAAGALVGSHDDPDPETRAGFRAMGATVAEFPMALEAAVAAAEAGDPVIMGAPNVTRGRSHKRGGLAARAVLEAGAATALASDYHYPAPLAAAARLVADGWPLARAWTLVSEGPARILGLRDRGRIAEGLRGDLAVVAADLSRVHGTFVAGRIGYADAVMCERVLA
ncbi:alpha-D-ribose 1-methylphosphonate 5-triphosphate diphosphatase [Rhodobacterales bacterium HKCCE2091]|nr:alpha-D-ribose 1-methylphosphonate 5-triphosphate diphosphatase [Rhodobacterales bacterium HKCCE2091]